MNLVAGLASVLFGLWVLQTLVFVLGYLSAVRSEVARPIEPLL